MTGRTATVSDWAGGDWTDLRSCVATTLAVLGLFCMGVFG